MAKYLFCGDVNGRLDTLFKRVGSVNKSNGPFKAVVCVGAFFPPQGTFCIPIPITTLSFPPSHSTLDTHAPSFTGSDDDPCPADTLRYFTGEKQPPLPTYFIGGFGAGSKQALSVLKDTNKDKEDGGATPPMLNYLGSSGVSQIQGLTVAYLDGTYNPSAFEDVSSSSSTLSNRYYKISDVDILKHHIAHTDGDIDLLLTNQWPFGVGNANFPLTPQSSPKPPDPGPEEHQQQVPDMDTLCCSPHAAELAVLARPRYHFTTATSSSSSCSNSDKGVFYARQPYLNKNLGAGSHVTRLIALGDVGNKNKQKWLHALALTPANEMSAEVLHAVPAGTTPCPYTSAPRIGGGGGMDTGGQKGMSNMNMSNMNMSSKRLRPAAPSLGRSDISKDKSKMIFARNVPFAATEEDIIAFFSQAGQVIDVVRRTSNQTGKLNSFCHVQFASEEDKNKACQLHGSVFMGRTLTVEPANFEEKRTIADGGEDGGGGDNDKVKKQRVQKHAAAEPNPNCWFCLSNPKADTHLVVSIGEECYLAVDKGAITDKHILILPVEHYPCTLAAPLGAMGEMARYMSALKSCYAGSGLQFLGFERYMALRKSGGNHCHINCIGIPTAAASKARETFEKLAAQHGFEFQHLPKAATDDDGRQQLHQAVGEGEYFVALLPDGSRLVHQIQYGERHPLTFGREVLAQLVGQPERAEWKTCAVGEEEEVARCEAFKAAFSKYDIMATDV